MLRVALISELHALACNANENVQFACVSGLLHCVGQNEALHSYGQIQFKKAASVFSDGLGKTTVRLRWF
jgi:hypothetical protein